jgi:hypothetical protein
MLLQNEGQQFPGVRTFGGTNPRASGFVAINALCDSDSLGRKSSLPVGYAMEALIGPMKPGGVGSTANNACTSTATFIAKTIEKSLSDTSNACTSSASNAKVSVVHPAYSDTSNVCTCAATVTNKETVIARAYVSTSAEPTPEQLASEVFATLIYDVPFREWIQVLAAFLAGESSGRTPTGGTILFRKPGDPATTVITGTLDANNNRTSVTLTP